MAPNVDPYRTLGLTRGATLAEVKQAYRRLAKANHPDAAGEAALPRFLAIQAAYDEIVGPDASGEPAPGRAGPDRRLPWGADPDRADATHRAYGGRSRRPRTGGSRRPGRPPPPPPPGPDRPNRPPNKATLGSTSYDGAEGEPFEPDWGGASWYGTTSGTYWTLNPKEYADPRKHGPEYQARARRAAATAREEDAASDAGGREPGIDPDAPPTGADPPTHTTSSWWDATAGPTADAPFPPDPDPPASDDPVDGRADRGLAGRVGLAVLGWIPIALGIGWIAGEVTGCGRFSATCDPAQGPLVWIGQLVVLAILIIWATRLGRRPVS